MQYSDEELLADLQQLADKLGEPPSSTDYREHGTYSLSAFYNHFDSWDQALQAADLEPPSHHAKIPDDDLLNELTRLADELGDSPTAAQMAEQGAYSPQTYRQRFGSWTDALRTADLDPTTHPNKIPDDELLNELTRLANELDEIPTVAQMVEQGAYSPQTYRQRFGSWTDALEEAGFERPFRATSKIPRSDLLDELTRIGEAVDDPPPSKSDIDEQGVYGTTTYKNRFGSWANALEEAGFEPTSPTSKIPRDELLAELTRVADEIDDPPPSQSDMTEHGAYSVWTYKNRFGSWTNAREAAGLDQNSTQHQIPREDLLAELDRLTDVVTDLPPTQDDMDELGAYAAETYRNRFGSWTKALEAIGMDSQSTSQKIPDTDLLAELERLRDELGHPPTMSDTRAHGAYATSTYERRFGSWSDALEAAGFEQSTTPHSVSRADLIAELKRLRDELGHQPTMDEMNEHGKHSPNTYATRFGSWSKALQEAFEHTTH